MNKEAEDLRPIIGGLRQALAHLHPVAYNLRRSRYDLPKEEKDMLIAHEDDLQNLLDRLDERLTALDSIELARSRRGD